MVNWIGIFRSKFCNWQLRYGKRIFRVALAVYLFSLSGCETPPATIEHTVASNPPGSTIYVKRGAGENFEAEQWIKIGTAPTTYSSNFAADWVYVVWPDGYKSEVKSSPYDGWGIRKRSFYFDRFAPKEAKKTAKSQTEQSTYEKKENVSKTYKECPVTNYYYDDSSRKGAISVNISGKGIDARDSIIENIGKICSDKGIVLKHGERSHEGAFYRVLNESVKDGILTVEFEFVR